MDSDLEKSLNELKKYFCSRCNSKGISSFVNVRSDKEIEQAITSAGLSKSAVHVLEWVLFRQDNPKKEEVKP